MTTPILNPWMGIAPQCTPDPEKSRWDDLYDEDEIFRIIFDEPLPAFISAPSPEYLRATEIRSILEVLGGHMR